VSALAASTGFGQSRTATQLALRGVTVCFGGLTALDKVSLEVPSATISGLIGPNGAGKSTLLAVASGLQPVTDGEVVLNGKVATGAAPATFARARIARTFQSPQLVQELDVRQHVLLGLCLFRSKSLAERCARVLQPVSQKELDRADELLEDLGLSEVRRRGPMELPLGMRRLVEVAQCLATDPTVLLLDEPSAGLNRAESQAFASLIARQSAERGFAVLLVEHDMDLVLQLCEQLFVLEFGKLIASGPTETVRTDPRVQEAYLGTVGATP
jgi:branched-chain amino acid transport system ATP-binding protein